MNGPVPVMEASFATPMTGVSARIDRRVGRIVGRIVVVVRIGVGAVDGIVGDPVAWHRWADRRLPRRIGVAAGSGDADDDLDLGRLADAGD